MKNKKTLILIGLLLGILIFVILLARAYHKEKKERIRLQNNLFSREVVWKSKEGTYISKVSIYESTLKELKDKNLSLNIYSNKYLNDLALAKKEIERLNLKLRDIQSIQVTQLVSQGDTQFKYYIKYDTLKLSNYLLKLDSLKFDKLLVYFGEPTADQTGGSVRAYYKYHIQVTGIINRNKYRADGTQIIFLPRWKFWKPWTYEGITTTNDKNAIIKDNFIFRFKKRGE